MEVDIEKFMEKISLDIGMGCKNFTLGLNFLFN